MLDINSPVQWQLMDDNYFTYMPWFTHGMLFELKKWDLSNKKVLEWGSGWSTVFWAFYAESVVTVETNEKWIQDISEYLSMYGLSEKVTFINSPCRDGESNQELVDDYLNCANWFNPDIVIIDGVMRFECLQKALTLKRPLTIIHDNWAQDGFLCPAAEELMKDYEIHNFIQEDHTDNHGNKWATAYWDLK